MENQLTQSRRKLPSHATKRWIRPSFRQGALERTSHGFTLIEAIIAAILMSILMLFLYKVSGGAFKFLARNQL